MLATEDDICSPKKGAVLRYVGGLVEDTFKMLPKSTRRVVIKGGNHAGFGDYGIRATASGRSASRTSRTRSRSTVSFLVPQEARSSGVA